MMMPSHMGPGDAHGYQTDEVPSYELYVQRSFAEYLWLWLEDAALEYGVAIGEG